MKTYRFFPLASLIISFTAGCASDREFERIGRSPSRLGWPAIRATAEMEVARKEGNTNWSHAAYFSPGSTPMACGVFWRRALIRSTAWAITSKCLIRDNGEVVSYIPSATHPR